VTEQRAPGPAASANAASLGPLPTFVIVGAMKAGTTSIRAYLDAHPDVFAPPETHFFTERFDRGVDWYRSQFAGAGDAKAIGDKTPGYMYSDEAVERMAATLPDARLIAILRNPIDRAYSHYWHHRRVGKESRSFEEAIAQELSGDGGSTFEYVRFGRYIKHLERLARFYPRERILVLLFEDLSSKPAEVYAEACRFLGIDGSVPPPIVGERTNTYRVYRARGLYETLNRLGLSRVIRLLRPIMVRRTSYEPMSANARATLRAAFADDNRALAAWLGRDLSAWDA
jgi:hypothetical protein